MATARILSFLPPSFQRGRAIILSIVPMRTLNALHAIVAAAGDGTRFKGDVPKNLVVINGRTVMEHSIASLLQDGRIELVHVAVASDGGARMLRKSLPQGLGQKTMVHRCGKNTRSATVLAASKIAREKGAEWLAIHDASRPCLHREDLKRLLDAVEKTRAPAILVSRLADTPEKGQGRQGCRHHRPHRQVFGAHATSGKG